MYTSTLDHEESGTYRVEEPLLLTTPAGQDTVVDRPVEITLLDGSNLHLNMMEAGKTRLLQFARLDAGAVEAETE